MSVTTASVAGGTTGSLPDIAVSVDRIASADYQRIKTIDPTADSTAPIGTESNPQKVKAARRGTQDYDSGVVALTNGAPTEVTAATIYPEGGTLSNATTSARVVTLTDGSDATIGVLTLAPQSMVALPVPSSGAWAGLKAGADGAGVVLQVAGRQA